MKRDFNEMLVWIIILVVYLLAQGPSALSLTFAFIAGTKVPAADRYVSRKLRVRLRLRGIKRLLTLESERR